MRLINWFRDNLTWAFLITIIYLVISACQYKNNTAEVWSVASNLTILSGEIR